MEHGSVEMYRKELREQEKERGAGPCPRCRRAQADYLAEYRATRARDRSAETRRMTIKRRALNRLALNHPEEFEALVRAEDARTRS